MTRMNFKIEKFNANDKKQIDALVKWDCDKELFHLTTPIFQETTTFEYPKPEDAIDRYQNPRFAKGVYVVFDGEKPIGQFSLQIDPPHLHKKISGTSWLGLIIGEREYWGTGAAKSAMEFFEKESIKLGLKRIELGTFEFNTRAIKFYKNLGYVEFTRLKNFTYFNNRFWDDIRMEKILLP